MYCRRIEVEVELVDGIGYRSRGEFEDAHHYIKADILFQIGGLVLEADAQIIRAPFDECSQGVKAIKNLGGTQAIDFKVSKEIYSKVAGPIGCTHLAELVIECIKARIQAAEHDKPSWIDPDLLEHRYKVWENSFANKCIHFTDPYWTPYKVL
ncbi:MAG: DUF2889 domain-containing protein [Candidatus Saccharibacteria bacterium]